MAHFPVRNLFDEVVAWFAAKGDQAEHLYGGAALDEHKNTNSFVWVPTSTRPSNQEGTRGYDKQRISFGAEHIVQIYCWGESQEASYLMAENVLFAIRELIGADAGFYGATWGVTDDEGATQLGNTMILEVGIKAAFIRRFTTIATYRGTETTPTPPDPPTTEIQSVTVEAHATENVSQDGQVMGSDSVAVEFSSEFSEDFT